jgi:hypothetical protein
MSQKEPLNDDDIGLESVYDAGFDNWQPSCVVA